MEVKAPAPQQTMERGPEVFFTTLPVKSRDVDAAIPQGYRVAHIEEIALAYKERPAFRTAFDALLCPVWSDKINLNSWGPHKIDQNGKFVSITEQQYWALNKEDCSRHSPGNGRVGFNVRSSGGYSTVFAGVHPHYAARVAYVALKEGEQKAESSNAELGKFARREEANSMPKTA